MAGPSYSPGPGFGAFVNQLANPPNPMDQLGKTVNALTAMKTYQAQQASEDAVRQAVDPVTGAVDMAKYNALLSQSPGAWNFSPLARQAGEAVGAQGQATSADEKAKLDQLDAIGRLTEPLYKDAIQKNYVNPADAQAQVDQAYQMKLITPQQYQAYSSALKSSDNAASWVIGANTGIQANRDLVLGHPGMANAGGVIVPYQPVPGALPSAAPPIQTTPSPDLMEKDVTVTLPGGGTLQNVPYWQAQAMERDPSLVHYYYPNVPVPTGPVTVAPQAGGAPGGTAPPGHYPAPAPAPIPTPAGGGGGAPAPAAPTSAPAASPGGGRAAPAAPAGTPSWAQPPPPPPAGAGGVGVTPSPSNIETVQKPSSAAATALTEQVNATRDTMPLLDDMQAKLESGQLTTGVGSTVVGTLRGLMQRLKLSPTTPSGATDTATPQAIQDEFAKDAALLQAAQLKTLGNPTDARQELAMETNPGPLLSTYGNRGIVSMLKGNQYAIRAEGQAWALAQKNGWDPTRFNEWQSQHFLQNDPTTGGRFDPRMFWIGSMSPQDQRNYIGNLPPDQQAQLGPNRTYALRMGWVTQRPDGTFVVANP